jgi:hypothetical protein
MRTKVKAASPETVLERLITALEQELVEASDEEVLHAARDLGMNPEMPGSAAFLGLTVPATMQLSDFFDPGSCEQLAARVKGLRSERAVPVPQIPPAKPARSRAKRSTRRERRGADKDAGEK